MRHHIKIVALNSRIDPDELMEFSLRKENYSRFGIIDENGFVTTSTFFSDELVRTFKKEKLLKESADSIRPTGSAPILDAILNLFKKNKDE